MTQPTQPLPPLAAGGRTAPLGPDPAGPSASGNAPPPLRLTRKLDPPTGVASNVKQHVLLVRDRSGSMAGSKIAELNMASVALCAELGAPENRNGFLVGVIDVSDGAEIRALAEPAAGFRVPEAVSRGGTNFDAALRKTIAAISDAAARPNPEGWRHLRPHVLFLSDGHSNVSDRNIADLHELADVTAIAYGDDASQETLARISSDGRAHVVGVSGKELRKFLAEVGKTLSDRLSTAR